jgi:hypothetical protein
MNIQQQRESYTNSLGQLLTISSILAGFTFSGLIALPSISSELFQKIIDIFQGDLMRTLYIVFFSMFFSTLCFLATISTIMVYKINNYTIPIQKLKRMHLIANFTFSMATAFLMIAVIAFAIPTWIGISLALFTGIGVAMSFLWENMLPSQRRKRELQLEQEQNTPDNTGE